jgi:hypothetical protein
MKLLALLCTLSIFLLLSAHCSVLQHKAAMPPTYIVDSLVTMVTTQKIDIIKYSVRSTISGVREILGEDAHIDSCVFYVGHNQPWDLNFYDKDALESQKKLGFIYPTNGWVFQNKLEPCLPDQIWQPLNNTFNYIPNDPCVLRWHDSIDFIRSNRHTILVSIPMYLPRDSIIGIQVCKAEQYGEYKRMFTRSVSYYKFEVNKQGLHFTPICEPNNSSEIVDISYWYIREQSAIVRKVNAFRRQYGHELLTDPMEGDSLGHKK